MQVNIVPKIEAIKDHPDGTTQTWAFRLSGVNVSIANAIRRVITSDLATTVFRTAPQSESKATIYVNTTRENNEYIKQRLGCIPIHAEYDELKDYYMELMKENTTNAVIKVTTEHFQIKRKGTNEPMEMSRVREIFPANGITGDYIWFLTLNPHVYGIGGVGVGEKIHLICDFDVGYAREDGMWNVACTCVYGNTVDSAAQEQELAKLKQTWKDEGKDLVREETDWRLLDGKRIFKPDSFDFLVETVGVYENKELVRKACEELVSRFQQVKTPEVTTIVEATTTIPNSFDVLFEGEDYTVGNVLQYLIYTAYFETEASRRLTFCGFEKFHPHDNYGVLRLGYTEPVELSTVKGHIHEACDAAIQVFQMIGGKVKKGI